VSGWISPVNILNVVVLPAVGHTLELFVQLSPA
jgi:hypothetical protein